MSKCLDKFYNLISAELSKAYVTTHQLLAFDIDSLKHVAPRDFFSLFSSQEIKLAKRYQDAHYFKCSIYTKAMLRLCMLCLLKESPKRLCFKEWDRQEHTLNTQYMLFFDYSFSKNWASVLISRQKKAAVGLQHHQGLQQQMALSKRFFSPAEWGVWLTNEEHAQTQYFFDVFVAKTAIAKAMGPRNFCNLSRIEVLDMSKDPVVVYTAEGSSTTDTWCVHFLNLEPRYSLCVCSQNSQGTFVLTKLNLSKVAVLS